MKLCKKCAIEKPDEDFIGTTGKICKECRIEAARARCRKWYSIHKEEFLAKLKEKGKKRYNPEAQRRYYLAHKEELSKYQKEYNAKYRKLPGKQEELNQYFQEYLKKPGMREKYNKSSLDYYYLHQEELKEKSKLRQRGKVRDPDEKKKYNKRMRDYRAKRIESDPEYRVELNRKKQEWIKKKKLENI